MPSDHRPAFLNPTLAGKHVWTSDCCSHLLDIPREERLDLLLAVACKVYAAYYDNPRHAQALALNEARSAAGHLRHDSRGIGRAL